VDDKTYQGASKYKVSRSMQFGMKMGVACTKLACLKMGEHVQLTKLHLHLKITLLNG
jgi:hypothetical protein